MMTNITNAAINKGTCTVDKDICPHLGKRKMKYRLRILNIYEANFNLILKIYCPKKSIHTSE